MEEILSPYSWTTLTIAGIVRSAPTGEFNQDPPAVSTEIHNLQYKTEFLNEDRELTGPVTLYLHASIAASDTAWIAYLHDLSPDGDRERPVADISGNLTEK